MTTTLKRLLPLVVAMGLSCGVAVAQTSGGTGGAAGAGSSMSGRAAQPPAGTGHNAETGKDDNSRADRKFIQDAAGMFGCRSTAGGSNRNPDVKASRDAGQRPTTPTRIGALANQENQLPAAPAARQTK
jgi:hypothetical protein